MSFALLTTTTLAYFTDRVAETITGKAGSLSIALAAPERGKKVFSYDTMNDFSLTITNDGNKSMDVRVLAVVSSNMPIEEGFSFENGYLPCYRLFGDPDASYSYSFDPGSSGFSEQYALPPLSGTPAGGEENVHSMEYHFDGLLNGSLRAGERETEPGGTDTMIVPLQIFFPRYDTLPGWELLTRNAYYRLTIKVYGKQHRNMDAQDWSLMDSFEV